jgi:hypothetical protein
VRLLHFAAAPLASLTLSVTGQKISPVDHVQSDHAKTHDGCPAAGCQEGPGDDEPVLTLCQRLRLSGGRDTVCR